MRASKFFGTFVTLSASALESLRRPGYLRLVVACVQSGLCAGVCRFGFGFESVAGAVVGWVCLGLFAERIFIHVFLGICLPQARCVSD